MADALDGTGSSESQIQTADTVVLKAKSTFVGTVERTYHDFNTHSDPLSGLLIFSHLPVPDYVLQEFLTSGAPPKGYIFVRFADEEYGNSLVAEEDVILLSRCFIAGDTVKHHAGDHMVGTVVGVNDSYILQSICRPKSASGTFRYTFDVEPFNPCDSACGSQLPASISHPRPHELLYDIPGRELKRAQDFQEGDHILYHDWVGVVNGVDYDVAIKLENDTVVWVYDPWELFVVIPNLDRSPVSIPEFDSASVRLPELNLQLYNGIDTMQPEQFLRGQLVLTNHKNLRNGRWLLGCYDPSIEPAGRILDVRSRRLGVQWLCPNIMATSNSNFDTVPQNNLPPYENLTSFRSAKDLRRRKDVVFYDHDKVPILPENAGSHPTDSNDSIQDHMPTTKSIPTAHEQLASASVGLDLRVGDRARFVDSSTASKHYRQEDANGHGRSNKISRETTFGFDLNEFKVISITQKVDVQWQDQSTTRHRSTDLHAILMPEQDLIPGDVVFSKEGMKQIRIEDGRSVVSDFNEMSYFEQQQNLRPAKVGIVQSVNSQERIAQVRWFKAPKIELENAGTILSHGSALGAIGPLIEDTSLYEIMAFPALSARRRDFIIIIPTPAWQGIDGLPSQSAAEPANSTNGAPRWSPGIPQLGAGDSDVPSLVSSLRTTVSSRLENAGRFFGFSRPSVTAGSLISDWVAEIIDIGLDGSLTVRFGGLEPCRDMLISRDQVLLRIDEAAIYPDEDETMNTAGLRPYDDADDVMFDSDGDTDAVDEVIDYEGGRRMDDDSDDDGWVTDDDGMLENRAVSTTHSSDVAQPAANRLLVMKEPNVAVADKMEIDSQEGHNQTNLPLDEAWKSSVDTLVSAQPSEAPPQFEVLSKIPENQFRVSEPPNTSLVFLKRINREHRALRCSLPSNTVYVRTYESRLDLLRCLIVGPPDTPYELAPFLIDLHLGPRFPKEPPTAHFHSWTSGLGRINPNLYEEGKICLSLLGTWPGKSETEGWSEKATILQVLISLQGLVFVRQPLYNEAGFELYREEKLFTLESQVYNEKAFIIARGFIQHALFQPVDGLKDVLAWLYLPHTWARKDRSLESRSRVESKMREDRVEVDRDLLRQVLDRAKSLIGHSERLKGAGRIDTLVDGAGESGDAEKVFLNPLSLGAIARLRRTNVALDRLLAALVARLSNSLQKPE